MKNFFEHINTFIDWLINIFIVILKAIVNIITSIDYGSLLDILIKVLSFEGQKGLAIALIGFEVTLIALYFIFLPIIIENKNKETYLGHKNSKWILYDRNKKSKFDILISKFIKKENNDMSIAWIKSVTIIMLSILFYILKFNFIIILLFILFIIFLNKKVLEYLSLISSEDYRKEIENNFLKLCKTDKEKVCDMLSKNKSTLVTENRETLSFILQNYENENMDYVYNYFYKELFNTNNMGIICMMFNEISNEIKRRREINKNVYFKVVPWDFNYLLTNGVNENNFKGMYDTLYNILSNNVEFALKDIDNYNELLAISYSGILKNNNLSEDNKHRLLKEIISIVKFHIIPYDDNDTSLIRYKYIFNLFKYFIDVRDSFGIEFMIDNLEENINTYRESLYSNIIITLMVYLYYLLKVENPPYVELEEKEYLSKNVYEKLKTIIINNGVEYCYSYDIDRLFDWIKELSHSWERFIFKDTSSSCVKTPMCDNAVITSERALFILYKRDIANNSKGINDKDLSIFRFTIENDMIKEDVLNSIKDFVDFIGFTLDDNIIKNYVDSLLEYASLKKKETKNDYKDIDYYKTSFKDMEKGLYDKMSKLQIFNGSNTKNSQKLYVQLPADKKMLDTYIGDDFLKWLNLDNIIEKKVLEIFSNIKLTEVGYTYDTDKKIFDKLKSLKKKYYYVRPSYDNLGEKYKYGDEYLKTISKFNVVNTTIGNKRFLIDDYKCELKDIFFGIRELKEKELSSFIKQYKKGKKYYIKDDYGFEIECTKEEIRDYCKNKYIFCILVFELGIDVDNCKGYEFVYKKKKLSK